MKYTFNPVDECNMCGGTHFRTMGLRLNTSQGMKPKRKTGIAVSVMKCATCELIFANPQPVPEDIKQHYNLPPESYWDTTDFSWHESYFAQEIDILKKMMDIKPGMKALDIGAGTGKTILSLNKAGFDAYGFEPSEPFYKKALEITKAPPEKLQLAQMETAVYPNSHFDFITFGAVLEHLYNPAESIKQAAKWLKPGGIIHIEVPSSRHLPTRIINRYYKLMGTNYVSNISPMHSPFHLYEFTHKSFVALAKKTGLTIAEYQYVPCEVLNFPKASHGVLKKIMKWTDTGLQLVIWLQKR